MRSDAILHPFPREVVPAALISTLELDLADLSSVKGAASKWLGSGKDLDILLNNAGIWDAFYQAQTTLIAMELHFTRTFTASATQYVSQEGASPGQYIFCYTAAGVMACPEMRTKDGFEYQLGVNHIGGSRELGHWQPLPIPFTAFHPPLVFLPTPTFHPFC
jgi:NAD(P)-dependent dehydrogenase (short-subunit alcohol dehydrogenase family)